MEIKLLITCGVINVMIHTVKGFGIVNKAEIDVFLELSCFFHDPADVGNLIFGSSAFSKTSLNIRSSRFTYCWSLAWRILSITLLVCVYIISLGLITGSLYLLTINQFPLSHPSQVTTNLIYFSVTLFICFWRYNWPITLC